MFVSSRVSRAFATVAIVASTATVGVSTAGADHGYPSAFEKSFLSSCTSGATGNGVSKKQAKAYCKAVLKCIEKKASYQKVAGGSTNAIEKCSKKHAKKLSS